MCGDSCGGGKINRTETTKVNYEMAKRYQTPEDMELQSLKSNMDVMNRRIEEILVILTGNQVYGVDGMKKDVRELKADVKNIKDEIADKKKREGFLSIKLETIPQKVAAILAFVAVLISVLQGIKTLFTPQ